MKKKFMMGIALIAMALSVLTFAATFRFIDQTIGNTDSTNR